MLINLSAELISWKFQQLTRRKGKNYTMYQLYLYQIGLFVVKGEITVLGRDDAWYFELACHLRHTDEQYKPALTGRDPQWHRRISDFEMPVRGQPITDIYMPNVSVRNPSVLDIYSGIFFSSPKRYYDIYKGRS